ncbi:MAG: alpha/beta fold hydrolase [Candidatus Dadabacteria bacterium]|nr:MAG: alpha/beta fold hydrolase [Candidatus Dadabacteria bacterium]
MAEKNRPGFLKRNAMRLLNAFERTTLGPLRPNVSTPSDVVWMWERSTLLRFELPRHPVRYRIPVIIIPPLMVKPIIFDLRPGHSMAGFLCEQGFDTYMLDYGVPEAEDRVIRVDDYVADFIPNAIQRVMEMTGAPAVSLIGWSMGGIMSYTMCGMLGEEAHVRNLVTIGSPLDFSKMFPMNIMAQMIRLPGATVMFDLMGNVPPTLTRNGFHLLAPQKLLTRRLALIQHYWDRDWVAGYEAMSNWVDEFIPYPGEAFKQFVRDFVSSDKLRRGALTINGQEIDLHRIRANILVFVGTKDDVAPPASVRAAVDEIPVDDIRAIEVPLGHIGLVAGSAARELVWQPMADWLAERSEPLRIDTTTAA